MPGADIAYRPQSDLYAHQHSPLAVAQSSVTPWAHQCRPSNAYIMAQGWLSRTVLKSRHTICHGAEHESYDEQSCCEVASSRKGGLTTMTQAFRLIHSEPASPRKLIAVPLAPPLHR